tara:strand:- start:67 stop:399 length:333 start_codon:yes stop_codon:yes gene_type:complete
MRFVKNFWNGDVPLIISYWVVGVILSWPVGFLIGFIVTFIIILIKLPESLIDPLINLGIIGWLIFMSVGIWRSADKYAGKKGWAIAAKVLVVIGVLSTLGQMLKGGSYLT